MENQNEENNKSKQEENKNRTEINANESVEMKKSKNSSEKEDNKEKEKSDAIDENKKKEDNNKSKSLTTEANKDQNKDTVNNNININEIDKDNNEDITNIKYVSENQLEQIKQKQKQEKQNDLYSSNNPITIKDLQKNPNKKLIINSPRSIKALYDSGFSLDQLYHRTFDEFISEHKEVLHIEEEARINRYHFYEKLRMDKINSLVEYREKLIQAEFEENNNNIEYKNNKEENERIKPMKNIILDNDKRIAQEEIDIMRKKHEKELANIIQLELDKDLFQLEMKKQQENYNKEYQKLNFLNFQSTTELDEKKHNIQSEEQKTISQMPNSDTNATFQNEKKSNNNFKSLSLPKKPKIFVDSENTYLDNLYTLQQTLINQRYEKKQKNGQQKLERLEKVRKITGEQRALKKRIGEERAAQNLQKNAIDFLRKHEDLVKEIQNKKINIFQNKKKFEYMTKSKNEFNNLKYIIKMDLIADLKRKDENMRMVKYAELLEKQSKTDQIKNDRSNVVDNKLLKKDYLNNERKKNIIKINEILISGINEKNLDKILDQFPQNKELSKVIKNYKDNKLKIMNSNYNTFKTEKSMSVKRPKSHNKLYLKTQKNDIQKINDKRKHKEFPTLQIPNILYSNKENNKALTESNKITDESDIKEKLRLYKNLLSKQFYEKVQKEKENEENRLKELEKIEDRNKKYELEKKFRKERALVYMRLERENQKLNDKINLYEFKLKNINNNN